VAHKKLPTKAREEQSTGDDADLAAIDLDDEPASNGDTALAGDTIKIGDYELPVSVLEQLPDEVLKRIKRKVKAGGEELEVTLADALASVPQARGWQKRMWEAAQREKGVDAKSAQLDMIARSLGTDPTGAIAKLYGVSRRQAADFLTQQALGAYQEADRLDQMSPQERERWQRMDELERRAARADELEKQEQSREHEAQVARSREGFLADMKPALEQAGIKANAFAIRRVSAVLRDAMDEGVVQAVTPEDIRWAVGEVKKELTAEREAEYGDADGEALIARIGEERAKLIARAYAKRVQTRQAPVERRADAKPRSVTKEKPRSFAEWQRQANEAAARRDRARGLR
jgi:hypothetical protein